MTRFIVEGGRAIKGCIRVPGAKNAALPILAASILAEENVSLADCPRIADVENMLAILGGVGAMWKRTDDTVTIDTGCAQSYVMPEMLAKSLRSSIFMLGPLLTRFGRAVCTFPGGCEIGHRPIDLHLKGLAALGASVEEERGQIICISPPKGLRGTEIHLDYPSVGATENIMMAAVNARGTTIVTNAAREPEIEDLAGFMNSLGYKICGAGSSTVRIEGGRSERKSAVYRIMPDRIVAGTLMCAAAMTGGELVLTNAEPSHIGSITAKLREAGSFISTAPDDMVISVSSPRRPHEIKLIETLPYPGFPTDMQAQFFALACIAEGTCVIVENVFENRFKHGAELVRMGASFTQRDRTMVVRGAERLTGAHVSARDLRAGAALTLAGLAADGETVIDGAELIDRGYERFDEMLNSLGASVRRIEGEYDRS